MHNSKLITILKTLTNDELERFGLYVTSPFFNKDPLIIALYNIVKKEAPSYDTDKLLKERVFFRLFPDKKMNSSLRVYMSRLTQLLKDFLVYLQIKEADDFRHFQLLEALRARNLNTYFLQKIRQNKRNTASVQSYDYYYYKHLEEERLYDYMLRHPKEKSDIDLQQVLKTFETYSVLMKLRYWCALLNRVGRSKAAYDAFALDNLLQQIEYHKLDEVPAVRLYLLTVKLLKGEQEDAYFQALKVLLKAEMSVPLVELSLIYTIAFNFCNKKVIQGNSSYRNDYFDLYRYMLDKKMLHSGKYMVPNHVKNLVTIGLQNKEFDWTMDFIKNYREEVAPQFQNSVFHFNMGAFHFYKKQFYKALQHLIQVDYINIYYHLDCKALLLKSYYELQETEALLNLADTFKHFIRNQQSLTASRKKAYTNFVRLLVRLYRVKTLYGKQTPEQLKAAIDNTKLISDRTWLEVKARGLGAN